MCYYINMPELPEVQTIVGDLEEKVVGLTIVDVWSDYKKAVRPSFNIFKKGIWEYVGGGKVNCEKILRDFKNKY